MSDNKRVKVKCDLYWAHLTKVNEMSGRYQVDLCNLSDAAVAALEEMGISVLENKEKKPEMGRFITYKSNHPIKVFDEDGNEINAKVGNGSKAKAIVGPYEWKYKNKKGISANASKIVITDLIEYQADVLDDNDDDVL